MKPHSRGQALVGVVISLIVLGILIPVVLRLTTKEAVLSMDKLRGDTAFQAAQSGQMKAALIISQHWDRIFGGGLGAPITGYQFDVTYDDNLNSFWRSSQAGRYSISIASGPRTSEVTVISIGQDIQRKNVRAIKATYKINMPAAAIFSPAPGAGITTHWGPVITSANQATGSVAIGTPAQPALNFEAYKWKAQDAASRPVERCNGAMWPGGATPNNSCFWSVDRTFDQVNETSSHTVYVDGNVDINATGQFYMPGSLIVSGNLTVTNIGTPSANANYNIPETVGPSTLNKWFSSLGMPMDAVKHIAPVVDTNNVSEWPGDNGLATSWTDTPGNRFKFGDSLCVTGCVANCETVLGNCSKSGTRDYPALRGFIYVGGNATFNDDTIIHGVLYVPNGSVTVAAGKTLKVYYDPAVFDRIQSANPPPLQTSWAEVNCDLATPPLITGSISCH